MVENRARFFPVQRTHVVILVVVVFGGRKHGAGPTTRARPLLSKGDHLWHPLSPPSHYLDRSEAD